MKSISNLAKLGKPETACARLIRGSVYTRARIVTESEKVLEAELRERCKALGWMCIKLTSQYQRGLPDRLILMPGGRIWFVELKRPDGGTVGRLQDYWYSLLHAWGFNARFIHTRRQVDELLLEIRPGAVS